MNALKKIIVEIIVALISILVFRTITNAEVGQFQSDFTFDDYYNNQDVYCLNYAQKIGDGKKYITRAVIDLDGDIANQMVPSIKWIPVLGGLINLPIPDFDNPLTSGSKLHISNAKLAYILSQPNYDIYGNIATGTNKHSGQVANAIWKYMPTWMNDCGLDFSGLEAGFATWEGTYNMQAASELLTEADKYSQLFEGNTSAIEDETVEKDIKIGTWGSYNVVGPFKWVFPGQDITNIEVTKENGSKINNPLICYYNGNEPFRGNIKSGREFYLFINKNEQFSKLTIKAQSKVEIRKVRMYFLEAEEEKSSGTNYQHYLVREIENNITNYKKIESQFTYKTPPMKGNLKIVKVNKNNTNVKLNGVGFLVKNNDTGNYVSRYSDGSIGYVDSKEKATEFMTDKKGEIQIKNLIVGTYVAYETRNPNHYGYKLDTSGTTIEVNIGSTTTKQIANEQIYIKLSGKVWLDKISEKQSVRNNLYKSNGDDSADILLNGITVRLKDISTGDTIKTATTANGGTYLFKDVLISKLSDYYIEFEYDGLTYTNVTAKKSQENGSKATESSTKRTAFNKDFSWVEGGKNISGTKGSNLGFTRFENGNYVHNLSYSIANHKATLINKGQYKITANTNASGYTKASKYMKEHFEYGQEEITNINLGLYEREQPDIALIKDIQNVRITVNDYSHIYKYDSRFANIGKENEDRI